MKENKTPSKELSGLTTEVVIKTIRDEMHAEHTLISNRMTWYVTSQSFLMTAYAVSFNNGHKNPEFFVYAVPILGITISVLTWIGVFAAFLAQEQLQKVQKEVLEQFAEAEKEIVNLYRKTTCCGKKNGHIYHAMGMSSPLIIPMIFFFTWVIAFMLRH